MKRRAVKLRPSTFLLANKPLPATPCSPQQPGSKGGRGDGEDAYGSRALEARGKPASTSGAEKGRQQNDAENGQGGSEPSPLMSGTLKDKTEKALPALPIRRVPSRFRHPIVLPTKTSWVPATRPLPTAIAEDKESPLEKHQTPSHARIIHQRIQDKTDVESQIEESGPTQAGATVIKISMVSKHDLPDAWKHAVSTPLSLKKAFDGVVDKLESTDDKRRRTSTGKPCRQDGKGVISPFQRLQRAAEIRRQRIAEGMIQESGKLEQSTPQSHLTSAPVPAFNSQSGDEKPLPEDDKDISDRDVLRGLRIVCAASADAEFDALVRSKTGLRLRRFLADLQSFEELSGIGDG